MQKHKNGFTTIFIVIAIIIIGIVFLGYLANQKSKQGIDLPTPTGKPQITKTLTITPSSENNDPKTVPIVLIPSKNSVIKTPVTIKGTIPPGWMFEGVFPIQIQSRTGGVLAQGQASEVTPGSWQSGEPVEFTASIKFPDRPSGAGYIVLMNDNPSGLPENSKSHKVPVIIVGPSTVDE